MPDQAWNYGVPAVLLFLLLFFGVPWLRARQDQDDKERRARQERDDQERRDRNTQLIKLLEESAVSARQDLKEQSAGFLRTLEQRDKESAEQHKEIASALRGLTTAIDNLQRRRQP